MAPRSIWNGTLAVGGVFVPVKVHSATDDRTVHFHEVHRDDGARIEHRRICPQDDREVPYEEVVKGYEVSEGKYVVLEDDELKAAAGAGQPCLRQGGRLGRHASPDVSGASAGRDGAASRR